MNKKILTWGMIVFLVPALACSLGGGGEESASSEVSLGAEPTEAPAPIQPPVVEDIEEVAEEVPAQEPTGPETTSLDGSMGLEQLDSFRANIFLEFTGARAGSTGDETTSQRQDYLLEVTRNPQARHQITTIKGEGGIESDAQSEYYLIDDVTYALTFGRWIAQAGSVGRSQFANPETFVLIPETAACDSEPETINGISAIHCSFTEADNIANSLDVVSGQGDIWFAEAGNYVVKYGLEAQDVNLKGRFAESGGYFEFETYTLGYELEDIDSGLTISLPAEAEGTEVLDLSDRATGGSSGLAAPDGADVFVDSDVGGMNYFSTEDLSTLVDFHLRELPAAGWQEVPDESYVDDNNALLIFENEEGILRTFISKDIDGGHFVSITLPFESPLGGGAGSDTTTSGGEADGEMPVLDDAAELFSGGGATTYVTEADITTVIEFYRQELSAAGWVEDTNSFVSTEDVGLLTFEKDGASITAAINKEADGRVRVNLLQQ